MFRILLVVLVILNVLPAPVGPRESAADGKVFAAGPAKVSIPDQDALLIWRDGIETLAIETRFVGPGRDFAWVVPLPARPEISPGTTGMFPTLRALCAPRLHKSVMPLWILLLYASFFVLVAMHMKTSWGRIAALFVGVTGLFTCMVLPSLGGARGMSGEGPAVSILDRQIIGSFDVATVASTDPAALSQWLGEHGFHLDPAAKPVIADYVARGWVFAASKLKRDADSLNPSTPHPLVFKFAAREPVYPLRLTAVENGSLKVDLYVLGPGRASAPGFDVERCAAIHIEEPDWSRSTPPQAATIAFTHTALAALAGPGLTLTKLSGTLSPRQMASDAVIRFGPADAYLPEYFTSGASMLLSMNIAAGTFLAGVFIVALRSHRPGAKAKTAPRVLAAVAAALASGGVAYAITPTLEEATEGRGSHLQWYRMSEFAMQVTGEALDYKKSGGMPTEAWVREAIEKYLVKEGMTLREGDSPGCYSFTVLPTGEVVFKWYDGFGQEHRINYYDWR